jgi:hypothetical protein
LSDCYIGPARLVDAGLPDPLLEVSRHLAYEQIA